MPLPSPVLEAPFDQRIRHGAWATALVVVGSYVLQLVKGYPPFDWFALFDLPIVIGLAFGLYRKSRVAAVGIIFYFVAVGVLQFIRWHSLPIAPYIILAFFLGRAIPAVFRYHKAVSQPSSSSHAA